MAKDNLTQILVIQDRSGSMQSVCDATIEGFNEFVVGQRGGPGEARLRLVQFDHEYTVVFDKPIADIAPLDHTTYQPRGNTALLDAMGRAITDLGADLNAMTEADRPGKVIAVVMTDGHENASARFTRQQIFAMVNHQRDAYQWEFLFLGANQDAIKEGAALGVRSMMALDYSAAPTEVKKTYAAASAGVLRARHGRSAEFTAEERRSTIKK